MVPAALILDMQSMNGAGVFGSGRLMEHHAKSSGGDGRGFHTGGALETYMDTDRVYVALSDRGMGRMDVRLPALLTSLY